MTAFGAFQRGTPPRLVTFYSDFISDTKPFGTSLSSNVLGAATATLSNTNNSAIGVLTLTVPTTVSGTTAVSRAGVYLSESSAVNLTVTRSFKPNRNDFVEARVKANHSAALVKAIVGFTLDHALTNAVQTSAAEYMIGFWARGGDQKWLAGVWRANTLLASTTTSASKSEWNVLGVQMLLDGKQAIFTVNGAEAFRWDSATPFFGIDGLDGVSVPSVEIRDKTGGGAGAGTHSIDVDYLMVAAERRIT